MRVKRQKINRRTARFYKTCCGFREPFKVLCDGTFLHYLLAHKTGPPADQLSRLLFAPARPFTTRLRLIYMFVCVYFGLYSLSLQHGWSLLSILAISYKPQMWVFFLLVFFFYLLCLLVFWVYQDPLFFRLATQFHYQILWKGSPKHLCMVQIDLLFPIDIILTLFVILS